MPAGFTISGVRETIRGVHRLEANAANPITLVSTWKIALFTAAATGIGADLQLYSTTNEVTGGGYVAGGATITPIVTEITLTGGIKAISVSFADIEYTSSPTFSFKHAVLYNASNAGALRALAWHTWNTTQTARGTTYSIGPKGDAQMPPWLFY